MKRAYHHQKTPKQEIRVARKVEGVAVFVVVSSHVQEIILATV